MEQIKEQSQNQIQIKEIQHLKIHSDNLMEICFSSDDKFLATCSKDKSVKVFKFQENKFQEIQHLENCHEFGIRRILFTENNKFAITCGLDGSVKVFKIDSNFVFTQIHLQKAHEDLIIAMNISKNNKWLVTGAKDTHIKFFDISNLENEMKEIIFLTKVHESIVCSIDFASDDKFIASGSFDGALQVFHLEKDADDKLAKVKSLHHLKALHSLCLIKVIILPRMQEIKENNQVIRKYKIITGSFDKSLKILQFTANAENFLQNSKLEVLMAFDNYQPDEIWNLNYFVPSQKVTDFVYIFTCGKDKAIQVAKYYDKTDDKLEKCAYFKDLHNDGIICMSFTKNGNNLVSSSFDGSIKLFQLQLN